MDIPWASLADRDFMGRREGLAEGISPDPRESLITVAGWNAADWPGVARPIQGDNALVWWGSGATGPHRLTRARTDAPAAGP
jgi:hypothetical protein